MATHHRVLKLRGESGISPPPQPGRPEQDPEAERNARLSMIQLESLGSSRRDRISREDFPENRRNLVSWKKLEAARLSNKPGTKENEEFQANEAKLKGWNNAWEELEGDGTVEEQFDDINRGQAHRARLMSNPEIRPEYGEEDIGFSLRRHHADNGGRARGGGRGGRGGGFAGSRSRVVGLIRKPVGQPPATQHLGSAAPVLSAPHREGGPIHGASSSTSGGSPSRGSPGPAQGGVSSPSREPSNPSRKPASTGRPVRPPSEPGWEFRLADPADFMKAAHRGPLASPSNVAPAAKSSTAPTDTASPSLATALTKAEALVTDTDSSSPAPHSTTPKDDSTIRKEDSTITKEDSPISKVSEAGAATPSSASHLALRKAAGAGTTPSGSAPGKIQSQAATREPNLAVSHVGSSTRRSTEEKPAEREPLWPTVSGAGKQGKESALIDLVDAFDRGHKTAYSHNTVDEAKGARAKTTSPQSDQSYTDDLLGLDIQPDVSQSAQIQGHRSDSLGGTDSNRSIKDIHTQLSSFMPLLKNTLEPELIKSYENIITELQVKSMGAARTSEAVPDIELPIEAFSRLSIHDQDPVPIPVSKKGPTAPASRFQSTFSPPDPAAGAKFPPVDPPRVRLPPLGVYGVETVGNVQQDTSPHPGYSINRPHAGINVQGQVPGVAVGSSISPPVPQTEVPTMASNQKLALKIHKEISQVTRKHHAAPEVKPAERGEVSKGSLSGQPAISDPAKVHEAVRSNFREAREQLPKDLEEEEDDDDDYVVDETIFKTIQPSTSGSTINRIGYLGAQSLQAKKENISSTGTHSSQAEASGSKSRAVPGEDHLRVAAGNVIPESISTRPAPAHTSKLLPTAKAFIPPHARINLGDVVTASRSVPADQSSFGIPGAVESQSQQSNQPTAAPSVTEEADKKDDEEEEDEKDYPLEAILRTTYVPSGPSMLNRSGFYRR